MNKKAVFEDFISIILVVFMFGTIILMSRVGFNEISSGLDLTDSNAINAINQGDNVFDSMDWLPIILVGVLFIIGIITASVYQVHPAFMIIGVVLLIIAVLIAGNVSDFFTGMVDSDSSLSSADASQPVNSRIMILLPMIVLVLGGVILFVMFSKGGA